MPLHIEIRFSDVLACELPVFLQPLFTQEDLCSRADLCDHVSMDQRRKPSPERAEAPEQKISSTCSRIARCGTGSAENGGRALALSVLFEDRLRNSFEIIEIANPG